MDFNKITVEVTLNAPIEKVWNYWSDPKHIIQWCHASDDWHTPKAENDLKVGGKFITTMAAKDGSFSFDFGGQYTAVKLHKQISYILEDGREANITFSSINNQTQIIETFDAEKENPEDMQRGGWQAILDNFKKHTENN